MHDDLSLKSADDGAGPIDPCGRDGPAYHPGNRAFRHHHMSPLLRHIGMLLPQWLDGPELLQEARVLERMCWRELGHARSPVFDDDVPAFLLENDDGSLQNFVFQVPMAPLELAARLVALDAPAAPDPSPVGRNFQMLARLLNFTPFESQWLLWSYCVHRFGRAILPVISLRDDWHACELLALLADMPMHAVQDAVASRRLHAWGLLDGCGAAGAMPSRLSGWLPATDQFADWIEQPYASDSDLLTALCKAQVSLMASR